MIVWDGWMASLIQWTWVWASSGRWWRTGKPSVLLPMESQIFRHNWANEQQCSSFTPPPRYPHPPFSISQSLFKLMSIESVMPSNHLILCPSLLLLPSIFPSIRVFFTESALRIRWPKYWSFTFSISPSNEYSGMISLRIDWLDLLAVSLRLWDSQESSQTPQFKSINSSVLSFLNGPTLTSIHDY